MYNTKNRNKAVYVKLNPPLPFITNGGYTIVNIV